MKKIVFLLSVIFVIGCSKNENMVPDNPASTLKAKRLAYLQQSVGTFYSYDDTLGLSDSVKVTHLKDSLFLSVYSSEFDTSFIMTLDTIEADSIGYFTALPFSFNVLKNVSFDDNITGCQVTNGLSTYYPEYIVFSFVIDGTYHSTLSPAMDNQPVTDFLFTRQFSR